MITIKFKGQDIQLSGEPPGTGDPFPSFTGVDTDLQERNLSEFRGSPVILNMFPSVDTNVCATSVRRFNQEAIALEKAKVINLSLDLPFAHDRFNDREGIVNVLSLSLYRSPDFVRESGLRMENGPWRGLLTRGIYVLDERGSVLYRELMKDIDREPHYRKALRSLE